MRLFWWPFIGNVWFECGTIIWWINYEYLLVTYDFFWWDVCFFIHTFMHTYILELGGTSIHFGGLKSIDGDRWSWWKRPGASLRSIYGDRWSRWEGPRTSGIKSVTLLWFHNIFLVPHAYRWKSWCIVSLHISWMILVLVNVIVFVFCINDVFLLSSYC